MSTTCFARFSLSLCLAPPPRFKILLSSPPALQSACSLTPGPSRARALASAPNRGLPFLRSMATDGNTEAAGAPESVPVRAAHELLQSGHRYLDVRTVEEFNGGHPVGATNIAYMFRTATGMTKNPNFLEEVSSSFGKDDKIVVGCQSGKRSLMAAADLSSAGFTAITDVTGGYSAWTQNGLPTEQ